jgi:hypothetical protein
MASNIVINDGTNDHTFAVERANGNEAFWRDWHESGSGFETAFVASKTYFEKLTRASSSRSTHRAKLILAWPQGYVHGDTGLPVLDSTARVVTDVILPASMASAERQKFFTIYRGLLNASGYGVVENLVVPHG